MNSVSSKSINRAKLMTRVGMLSALGLVLMYFQLPLTAIAPSFIQLDISDVPALIGSFAMGPQVAILVCALKNIFAFLLKGTMTGGVGEISNFIVGSIFTATAGIIYRRNKTFKMGIVSLLIATLVMSAVAMISNYFFIFPLYANIMPMEAIINAGNAITPKVTDLWSMMVYTVLPFNIIKGLIQSAVVLMIYKKISPLLKD